MKRFFVFLLAIVMCVSMTGMTTFASEIEDSTVESNELVETLPADAKVLYQDDGVVVYQSKSQDAIEETLSSNNDIVPYVDNNYGYVWLEEGATPDSFKVYNTHTQKLGVTWKIETSAERDYVQMWMKNPYGITVLTTQDVFASDGDVRFVVEKGVTGYYTVNYIPVRVTTGMRVMCWTYTVS